jgi:hypothetical protein
VISLIFCGLKKSLLRIFKFRKMLFNFLICFCLTIKTTLSQTISTDILPDDYNRDSAPTLDDNPVEVFVAIVVLSFNPTSNADMVRKNFCT